MNDHASPGQLVWRKLRKHRAAALSIVFLSIAYFITLFADFFSPYSPTADEFRDLFFHPPTPLHFHDAHGQLHLRPYVYRTHLIDSERLVYVEGTPLYLIYREPDANLNPYLPDEIRASKPVISVFDERGTSLGSASVLYETGTNTGEFQATIMLHPSAARARTIMAKTQKGDQLDVRNPSAAGLLKLVNENGQPLTQYSPKIEAAPLRFFVHGWQYKLFGFIPSRLHLYGVDPPAHVFLFGTDQSGRDIFSRLLFGARISLSIGLFGVLLTTIFGLLIGGIAGYYGGTTDHVLMRIAEVLMSIPALYLILTLRNVIPTRAGDSYDRIRQLTAETFAWQNHPVWLAIVLLAALLLLSYYCYRNHWRRHSLIIAALLFGIIAFGQGMAFAVVRLMEFVVPENTQLSSSWTYFLIILILSTVGWAAMARVIRGMVLSLRESEYVVAARALGASDFRTLTRHILPNTFGFVIVRATLLIPAYILGEVALSFLGVGVQEPVPSWGNMLAACQSVRVLQQFTWSLAPGYVLFFTVLAYNFLGDGLRDALDPRQ